VSVSYSVLKDREKKTAGGVVIAHDMTAIQKAEAKLRESEERYRSQYIDSRYAIMTLTPEQGFLAGNPATVKLFACRDEQEFTAQTPGSLSPEYQPDGLASKVKSQEMMRLALEKGSHFFEWTHRKIDGTDFPATVLLSRLESGGTRLLQATVHDITERKKAEEALRIKDRAIESAINAMAISDLAGNLNYVNSAFLKLWGYSSATEVLGKSATGFWQMGEKAADIIEAMRTQGGWSGEMVAQRKEGALFDVQVAASMAVNAAGRPLCMLASFADITESKQNLEQLTALSQHLERANRDLQASLDKVKTLSGLVPICANCKKIRDDRGYWNQVETYIEKHSDAQFSHGICPECAQKLYPELYQEEANKKGET
jgi:PAS domain S-box-containing protein